jgi:hypothetical protein
MHCTVQSGVGAVGSGLSSVGGAVGGVVPGLGNHDLSADALKAREEAVQAREDACKVRFTTAFLLINYFLIIFEFLASRPVKLQSTRERRLWQLPKQPTKRLRHPDSLAVG